MEVKRGKNGTFKCGCGNGFKLPWSLKRRGKGCSGEAMRLRKGEEEDMQISGEGSDASESAEFMEPAIMPPVFRPQK